MLPILYIVENGIVRVLIACGGCFRTSSARWPEQRFECSVCAEVELVELPPAANA